MGRIAAIGGGEIGRPGYPLETLKIDMEIKRMTEKNNPVLCFLPTASNDSPIYTKTIFNHFEKRLGCSVIVLELSTRNYGRAELEETIFTSDIVYVGGGDTKMMLEKWKETGLNRILVEAFSKDIVLSGLSAGAVCWFKFGCSGPNETEENQLRGLSGLNIINTGLFPHYNIDKERFPDFRLLIKKHNTVGIALDDCAAIKIENNHFEIVTSRESANAWLIRWEGDTFSTEKLEDGYSGDLEIIQGSSTI